VKKSLCEVLKNNLPAALDLWQLPIQATSTVNNPKGALLQPTKQPIVSRKRGRPPQIPDKRKADAAVIKQNGGSNRDAAKKIYNTPYPSPQQVKNVPTILRHYQATQNNPGRP
jgi:hypothetical protein